MYNDKIKNDGIMKFLKPVIWGVVLSLITVLAITVIAAFVISKLGSGIGLTGVISTVSLAVGCFVGGITASKLMKEKGLLIGAVTGALSFIIIVIAALIFVGTDIGTVVLVRLAICVLSSAIGGVIGVNSRDRQKIIA